MMSPQYDLAVVRTLLEKAFSMSDLDTLAFDLFHELYDRFPANLTKPQKAIEIVDYAEANGGMSRLLNYVRERNPYQYSQFAGRLVKTAGEEGGNRGQIADIYLVQERERLEPQRGLLNEKVKQLRKAHAIEADTSRKFQIEQQLREAEAELNGVVIRLNEIEMGLS
jgi:hypothetical protein